MNKYSLFHPSKSKSNTIIPIIEPVQVQLAIT